MKDGQVYVGDEIAMRGGRRPLAHVVAEYEERKADLPHAFDALQEQHKAVKQAVCVGGTFFHDRLDLGHATLKDLERLLLRSAWRHVYESPEYNIKYLASAQDKNRIERMLEDPPAFTMENLFEWFGDLAANPRASILRGLAEVFVSLDPAFKSHEKMKVGVKGLPKRVILPNVGGYGWGRDRLMSIINAIAAVQGLLLAEYRDVSEILDDGDALKDQRGIWLKRFGNGNGHLFFAPETLKAINKGLAEFYGEVLPDCPEERPTKRAASTEVSKDLQYYPTPVAVVKEVLAQTCSLEGKRVLEPSCGCGRFLDALRAEGVDVFGIEVDAGRVAECRAKGHSVQQANFLEVEPSEDFDHVVMNPPFYGRHYAKHVRHALRFLKPGGTLYAILPITARHDHGELDDLRPSWRDLDIGAFRESGTNINTTVATIRKAAA